MTDLSFPIAILDAELRRCPHAEITTFCGCPESRCDDRAVRLRRFMERGGWPDGEKETAWAESLVEAGLLTFMGPIALPASRYPSRYYRLTAEGRALVGPVRSYG